MWPMLIRAITAALRKGSSVRVGSAGRFQVRGLIGNRPLSSLTQQEIRNALAKSGLREAHNSHFMRRLITRGPNYGIRTLNDLTRAINSGTARAGAQRGTIEIVIPNGRAAVVVNSRGELITLLPL